MEPSLQSTAISEPDGGNQSRKPGITGSTLKLIAIITMLIDHAGAVLVERWMQQSADGTGIDEIYPLYIGMRSVGRIAFPILIILLVEGMEHTRNRWKYLIRLWIFAIVSEIPFDMAFNLEKSQIFSGQLLEFGYQNVFFTLFLGLLVITGLQLTEQHFAGTEIPGKILRLGLYAVIILAGCALAILLKTDYNFKGVLAITVLYLFRSRRKAQIWAGVIVFLLMDGLEMIAALSFIPIWFYDGTRGKQNKYFFYFFYPIFFYLFSMIFPIISKYIHRFRIIE